MQDDATRDGAAGPDVDESLWRAMLAALRETRLSRRISIRSLAKMIGVHSAHLSRVEKCEAVPNVILTFRWCRALRIDFGMLHHGAAQTVSEPADDQGG